VPGILADVNNRGQVAVILRLLQEDWRAEIWNDMRVHVATFANVGLAEDASDLVVWEACQQHGLVLITGNRNAKGNESLELTIRTRNAADSLPVVTISAGQRVMQDRAYAVRVADSLLEYLIDIDKVRGTGRLYVP
jgi:hypothetical protein